jgi:hypothetical protein
LWPWNEGISGELAFQWLDISLGVRRIQCRAYGDSTPCQGSDPFALVGPLGGEFGVGGIVIVGVIEAGHAGATEEGHLAAADEVHSLPDAGRHEDLDVLSGEEVGSERENGRAPVGIELHHLNRVAEVEVEDFVGVEQVHLRECAGFEEVVDGGALGTGSAGKIDGSGGGKGSAEVTALDGVGSQIEQGFYLVSSHRRDRT